MKDLNNPITTKKTGLRDDALHTFDHLQLNLVAAVQTIADTAVSKKDKLLARFQKFDRELTWDEAVTFTRQHGCKLIKNSGSSRIFRHEKTGTKIRLHEPHPEPYLKRYMVEAILDGLKAAGEI
ncbi:MAG TPA: type II toxin-antitoxin system HicA family toxin [Steroidobacteraceae bacterium]|nr:type II toxin-antitoxin system HicA family toxin [Steroidobacteraceae bacterium]